MKGKIVLNVSEKKRQIHTVCGIVVCIALLTGCTFKQEKIDNMSLNNEAQSENREVSDGTEIHLPEAENDDETDDAIYPDTDKVYYNTVKYYDDYFYYAGTQNLCRIDRNLSSEEELAEGPVRLGNCADNYIYYIKYPSEMAENSGIARLNLEDLSEETLLDWTEDMWLCSNVYVHDDVIYLEKGQKCEAYEIAAGRVNIISESDNLIYEELTECGITNKDMSNLADGYVNSFFNYHVLVYLDRVNKTIILYDTEANQIKGKIESCESDVLVTDRGLVYRGEDDIIYRREWGEDESVILYEDKDNSGRLNYGTYDGQYIYGFYENGDTITGIRIAWEGGAEKYKEFDSVKLAVSLDFSANNGVISYRRNGNIVFEEMQKYLVEN